MSQASDHLQISQNDIKVCWNIATTHAAEPEVEFLTGLATETEDIPPINLFDKIAFN